MKKLPLFELTETLIEIFKLGREPGELAYLMGFQDLVLEFYHRERNDIASFLEWWEENKKKEKTSIKISGEVDAVKILSIHKAKGLQFKYVLIPFCSWNTDHNKNQPPALWVKSEEAPFTTAGYLPVNYSGALEQTYFKQAYQEEHTAAYLDNLNLLYVALTRAEKGMIISAPHPKTRFASGTVAKWVYKSIEGNEMLKSSWNEASEEFVLGDWSIPETERKEETSHAVQLKEYGSSRWRDKLVIRQAGTSYFEENETDQRKKINFGIHLHAILSRIEYADEVPVVLERLVQDGLIQGEDKTMVLSQLNKLMLHPVVGRWFSPDWKVKTEVPILLPGGAENRIDRLILKGDKAIVIDFKTGEKTKSDQKQVAAYMEILKQMNFKEIEGYLLYTRDQEVISISDGKQKVVKKKDESQLGLGF